MSDPIGKSQENTTNYTEMRAHANELLKYVAFASNKDVSDIQDKIEPAFNPNATLRYEKSNISELLLGCNEPIPLHSKLVSIFGGVDGAPFLLSRAYNPFFDKNNVPLLKDKLISLIYHDSKKSVSYSSVLTDISALFCTMMPSVEMSLCVPYFDVNIIYPASDDVIPKLNILKFVGAAPKANESTFSRTSIPLPGDESIKSKYGFDVVGMEIFGIPQTLAPTTDSFKTEEAYLARGVDVLNPISPLMTIESAKIDQIGIGGGLNTQSKITLGLVLHDRSRLSDIEPLVSSSVFPLLTFRVTYGWLHPDSNKMTANPYAKLLNTMRVVQDYCVVSVNFSAQTGSALKLTVTLSGRGTQCMKSAKIVTANGDLIPYSAVDALVKQFIALRTRTPDKKSENNFVSGHAVVGSTIISSVTSAAASKKFVHVDAFYKIYEKLTSKIKNVNDLSSLVDVLNQLQVEDNPIEKFNELFNFPQRNIYNYGEISNSILSKGNFINKSFSEQIKKVAIETGILPPLKENFDILTTEQQTTLSAITDEKEREAKRKEFVDNNKLLLANVDAALAADKSGQNESPTTLVPLAEMISHLIAKPLLLSQPDIIEVRIHCFPFNSACGLMAEENIGNFPIHKTKFLQYKEEEERDRKINMNTTVDGAFNLLVKHVNDPTSPFYGFSSNYTSIAEGAEFLRTTLSGSDSKTLQAELDTFYETKKAEIDDKNSEYLKNKNITLTDSAFVPSHVKFALDTLPAYEFDGEKYNSTKKIARIVVYDERVGSFNKLGNLIFSMINSNGVARIDADSITTPTKDASDIQRALEFDKAISYLTGYSPERSKGETGQNMINVFLKDKKAIREVASNLFPTLVVGSAGSLITNASYSSATSGEIQSSYLLTALQAQGGSQTGAISDSPLVDDVFVNPSTLNLTMMGNVCIARGQTYYVDFNTGTTLDNAYTVTSVSHSITQGKFTTSAILSPLNSASIRSVQRQINELVVKVKKTYGIQDNPVQVTKTRSDTSQRGTTLDRRALRETGLI